jgi:hypothetical protein
VINRIIILPCFYGGFDILSKLWSLQDEPPSSETLRALIKRLRQKLKSVGASDLIETVYGMEYRLNPVFQKAHKSKTNIPISNSTNTLTPESSPTPRNDVLHGLVQSATQSNILNTHENHNQSLFQNIKPPKQPEAKVMVLDNDKLASRLVRTLL